MCALCDEGFCPRHTGSRYQLDLDPYHTDWRENEQEAYEKALSTVDFKEALNGVV
jgi:hypothetical protein